MSARRRALWAAGAALALFGAGAAVEAVYLRPLRAARAEVEAQRRRVGSIEEALARLTPPRTLRTALAPTTLGNDEESVAHWLRTLLSEAGTGAGLAGVSVDHARPRGVANPAAERASKLPSELRRRVDEGPRLMAVSASVTGVGTLEQVTRAIATLQAQPWVHRFAGVRVEPTNRERGVLTLRADVVTLFMPGLREASLGAPALVPAVDADIARAVAIAGRNPFVVPPPQEAVAAAPPAPAPTPAPTALPAPPEHDAWRVVGIVEFGGDAAATEVLLVRAGTEAPRVMRPGDEIAGAVLESARDGRAMFRIDGRRYEVDAGRSIGERRPATVPVDS